MKTKQLRWLTALLLLVAAMVMPSVAWAQITPEQPQEGIGTKDNPYKISSAEQLYWFAGLVNGTLEGVTQNASANAELTANIEVNPGVLTSDGSLNGTPYTQWPKIMEYNGTFDGKGHTISGLFFYSNAPDEEFSGLFATTHSNAEILNLGIVDSYFHVDRKVGGVCGWNSGTIKNCYNKSTVSGKSSLGGVCGWNDGTIENCFNTGKITDGDAIGGVCGENFGTIKNCYNTGTISGGSTVGGVCGNNFDNGTITNCYYLSGTATAGISINGGTGSAEVKTADQFNRGEVAWLLNGKRSEGAAGSPLAWYQNINNGSIDNYPLLDSSHRTVYRGYKDCILSYSNNQEELSENPVHNYDNGICKACKAYQPATLTTDKYDINGDKTNDNVYEIGNAGQLYWFAGLVNGDTSVCNYDATSNPSGTQQNKAACAVLTANIVVNSGLAEGNTMLELLEYDASGKVTNGGNFVAWTPIGFNYQNYTGTFDGKGYTVSGLYFNDTSKEKVGLFGRVDSGGKISNVGVLDSYFEFSMQGGGICGLNYGEINNCTNGGTVIGNGTRSGAGGVCGMNYGTVKDCKNTGSVSGTVSNIGGVCGAFYSGGSIENCLNEGTVSGTGETVKSAYGGVCGYADGGVIKLSSNTASVSGQNSVGGVCGQNAGATLEDCYNTGAVVGTALSSFGGVCGSNSSNGTIKNCYNTGAVSGKNSVGGVCGNYIGTITNCYYLSGTATGGIGDIGIEGGDVTGSAESKSADKFRSGEVAYLLNEGKAFGTQVWGQQLGVNDYPVLGSAYKVLMAARDGLEGSIYWATFSNLNSNAELIDPMGGIAVYNATVSDGTLTLAKRSNKVSLGEGILLKATSEYVNAKNISDEVSAAKTGENDLVATPKDAGVINAGTGYTLYRLTYNKTATKEGLGFYLGVVGESKDGSQLKATPGKAYLNVLTSEVTEPSTAKLARGFAFPGDDGETTGIECITVTDEGTGNNWVEGIFDLQGRKVSKPKKGVYINNGKKVIIK